MVHWFSKRGKIRGFIICPPTCFFIRLRREDGPYLEHWCAPLLNWSAGAGTESKHKNCTHMFNDVAMIYLSFWNVCPQSNSYRKLSSILKMNKATLCQLQVAQMKESVHYFELSHCNKACKCKVSLCQVFVKDISRVALHVCALHKAAWSCALCL